MATQPDHEPAEEELRHHLEVERRDIAERIARYERDRRTGKLSPGVPHEEVKRRLGLEPPPG